MIRATSKSRIVLPLLVTAIYCLLGIAPAWAQSPQCDGTTFEFYEWPIGMTSPSQTFIVSNDTNLPNRGPPGPDTIVSLNVNTGPFANSPPTCEDLTNDYTFGGTCVVGLVLMPGESCTITATFTPQGLGPRNAILTLNSTFDIYDIEVAGMGVTSDFKRPTVPVVEYYDAAANEYFITSSTGEIAALDTGARPGWVRTGANFNGFATDPNLDGVCRYYVVTSAAWTHWYFTGKFLCGLSAGALYAQSLIEYVEEDPEMFDVIDPTTAGWCPYGATPLYSFWDRKISHRYTTDQAIRAEMLAQGWIAEGSGPDTVFTCVSQ